MKKKNPTLYPPLSFFFPDFPFICPNRRAADAAAKTPKFRSEIRRWQDIKNPGSVNQDPIFKSYNLPPNEVGYPGGVFNPLNFVPTLQAKEKEIANGRLAMLAFLGFVVQHNVTGKGPYENLLQHLSDP